MVGCDDLAEVEAEWYVLGLGGQGERLGTS